MEKRIRGVIDQSIRVHKGLYGVIPEVVTAAEIMKQCLDRGNKILFAGNGGSAADAQHLAAELVNRFLKERDPIPGIALTTDTSILISIGNDYGFDEIFSKQIRALGRQGDVFFGISTSGNSSNILKAFEAATPLGISTIALTGANGVKFDSIDCTIAVPSEFTPRIQEMHILIGHILCELIEADSSPAD